MQHGHQHLPSSQHSAAVSQQLESHTHLSTTPQYSPSHFVPPSRHHSQVSSFQTTFPVAPSPHVINDPTSHSSSRRSIPSLLQNQQYQQHNFSTHLTHPQNPIFYPPHASQASHPYLHQTRYPANDTSSPPNCGHMLYMHTPTPTHPPYYRYQPAPSIPVQTNPDQPYQQPHPIASMPPPPGEPGVGYQESQHVYQGDPADHAMQPRSSSRAHIFGNENMVDPMQSLPGNISTVGNRSKDPDNFMPLTSLPPLRSAPSRVTGHSFYPSPQGVPNMSVMMPPSRSVLSTVPYHPSTYMSPSIPAQHVQQVADTGHFYNNPYHHNTQSGFPPEQHYQRTPVNNVQWQTNLAPAAQARSTKDGADDVIGFPSYYVGPDGVTRYYGQQAAPRKKRLQWTAELHAKFVKAVEEFGVETAVPKLLLQAMNVPGLTRENVASHLQKYREGMRKKKLEKERCNSGMKTGSKETGETKMVSDMEANDEVVSGGQFEAKGGKDRRSLEGVIRVERGDSTKRLRDIEKEASETVDNKKQRTTSNMDESEALKETELTKQEVESYARVRARVDEALQIQKPRSRQGQREPDVT